MKIYQNFIALGLLLLMTKQQAFSQINRNGIIGLVDLYSKQLFVNTAKGCFVSDNEKYFPCLFTIEFPNSIDYYWFDRGRNSEFLFKFEKNQFAFVYDDVKCDTKLAKIPVCFSMDKKIHEIDKDSAEKLISIWKNQSSDRDMVIKAIGLDSVANSANGHFYVATCSNVLFIFYNITDLDVQRIIMSFTVIRPHLLQIIEQSD